MLIHNPIFTGSISLNGSDISKVSTVSADSSSFASRITQTESTSSAYVTTSGSFSTRITNTESTASAYITASGSFSTRTTAVEVTASQYVTASGSFSTRVTATEATASAFITASGSLAARLTSNEAKTGSFATTGSNQFNGSQTITGSLTATGTITAQTLVVQTITSSVDFVSGSTRFGTIQANTHEFTGSVLVTGSATFSNSVTVLSNNFTTTTDTYTTQGTISYNSVRGLILRAKSASVYDYAVYSAAEASIIVNPTGTNNVAFPSGKVLIGTTSTSFTPLFLNADGNYSPSGSMTTGFAISNSTTGRALNLGVFDSGGYGWIQSAYVNNADTTFGLALQPRGGNVGVGTTSPSTLLHINGTSTQITLQNADGGTNAERIGMFMTSGDTFKIISLNDNNTTRVDNILVANVLSGNVGIGTTSPNSVLEVAGTSANTDFRISRTVSSSTYFYIKAPGGSPSASNIGINGTDVMTLNSSGNVGIGTSTPCSLLHITPAESNSILWPAIVNNPGNYGTSGYGVGLRLQNSTISGAQETHKWAGVAAIAGGTSGYSNETDLAFYVGCFIAASNCTCPPVEKMRIKSSTGNVGIGTTAPASNRKLTVAGGAQFTGGDNSGASFNIVPGTNGQDGADFNLSYYTGTGYGPLTFTVGGAERMRITSTGISCFACQICVGGMIALTNTSFGTPATEAAFRVRMYDNGGVNNDPGIGLDGAGGGGEKMWFNALSGFYFNYGTNGAKIILDGSGNLCAPSFQTQRDTNSNNITISKFFNTTATLIGTISDRNTGTTAVAVAEYANLYSYNGDGFSSGMIISGTRSSNGNTTWTTVNSCQTANGVGGTGQTTPAMCWFSGALCMFAGGSNEIVAKLSITYHQSTFNLCI